jgi:hypothetical protein
MVAPPGWSLIVIASRRRHSIWTGLSATRGGRTTSLASGVSPERANSSTSGATSAAVWFIATAISSETILTTNSRVASTLRSVSLVWFIELVALRTAAQNKTVGGFEQTAEK